MGMMGELNLLSERDQARIAKFKLFKKYSTKYPCYFRMRYEGTNFILEKFNRSIFFREWEMISQSGEWENVDACTKDYLF
jgi:hypothetical protein